MSKKKVQNFQPFQSLFFKNAITKSLDWLSYKELFSLNNGLSICNIHYSQKSRSKIGSKTFGHICRMKFHSQLESCDYKDTVIYIGMLLMYNFGMPYYSIIRLCVSLLYCKYIIKSISNSYNGCKRKLCYDVVSWW